MRLDRFLSNLPRFNRQDARRLLAGGSVRLDGQISRDGRSEVSVFSRVELDGGEVLQAGKAACYFMLHKPPGVVSATVHPEHRTVLDLLDEPDKHDLHLAGRLDLSTSGLLLITNDGQWSRRVTLPKSKQPKVYLVDTADPIDPICVEAFARGLYFQYEDLVTQPAVLDILAPRQARLTLYEGRYHQVKRMFGHFRNRVVGLHRLSMGAVRLDPLLAPGHYRALTATEVASFAAD
ncbi:pseudouridine synthase [Pseudomonas lalucatii]|uniref:Pseudouridine synthase n=1 Tax=Pseudomonas lalucatii TaxID=1424203 RepID=A0ABS5PYI8_9PSED|nr:pseudouridine synthase [Pseudomonas lalucatii]MBS7661565.1 pseudouridine synthase [Pseudomonas lalucatii]MBS7691884.1 pseudouridine synthase [Pseudomonas lalucatii]MBS7723998.1 pseudouridine synthase [Pseudomonas lalucatii]QVM87999.1 pseudouridine synthase [Pseudomonas lalucatii]